MGWDVVQIGLRHNLPIDDPMATAKEIATRMKQNIRLVARMIIDLIQKRILSILHIVGIV